MVCGPFFLGSTERVRSSCERRSLVFGFGPSRSSGASPESVGGVVVKFAVSWSELMAGGGMCVGVCHVVEESILGSNKQVRDAVLVPVDESGAG